MKKSTIFWLLGALCALLGLGLLMIWPSVRFTGWLLVGLGCLLGVYGFLYLRKARKLRRILTACLCLGLVAAVITLGFVWHGSLCDPEADCDYLVVLGAGVRGTMPSLTLRERIDAAYTYLTTHPHAVCVVSGGQGPGEDISEAACMYRELVDMGIDPDRIWQEDQSTSTLENLTFTLALIEEKTGAKPEELAIVSSEYHLFRAGCMAQSLGITARGVPAQTAWASLRVNYFLREIAAVWYYLIGRIFI